MNQEFLGSNRAKEKQDVDDLEVEDTKKLFLEQGTWDAKHRKEMQEYLDAKNKEVKWAAATLNLPFSLAFPFSNAQESSALDKMIEMKEDADESVREKVALVNSKVRQKEEGASFVFFFVYYCTTSTHGRRVNGESTPPSPPTECI